MHRVLLDGSTGDRAERVEPHLELDLGDVNSAFAECFDNTRREMERCRWGGGGADGGGEHRLVALRVVQHAVEVRGQRHGPDGSDHLLQIARSRLQRHRHDALQRLRHDVSDESGCVEFDPGTEAPRRPRQRFPSRLVDPPQQEQLDTAAGVDTPAGETGGRTRVRLTTRRSPGSSKSGRSAKTWSVSSGTIRSREASRGSMAVWAMASVG